MSWVRTPDEFWEREEVIAIGVEAAALHLAALGYSNRNLTDGRLPGAKAVTLLAVEDVDMLIDALVEAGWWTETAAGWQLVYLLELQQTKAEVLVKRERGLRRTELYSHPELVSAVRARDGDACRYCGIVVNWHDRRGRSGGTYDHVDPDGPNTTDNLVVACRACNSSKGGHTPEQAGIGLRPVPAGPADPYLIPADQLLDSLPENLSASRYPDPVPGPVDPVPEPGPARGAPEVSDGAVAAARPPAKTAAKPPSTTPKRMAQIVDLVRSAGVPIHPTSRDGGVLKSCAAPAALIAEAYIAAYRREWDPVGDGFIRGNLSLHLVIDRLAGYQAQHPPDERRYLLNGSVHLERLRVEPVELAF